jgi:hypothetical protein
MKYASQRAEVLLAENHGHCRHQHCLVLSERRHSQVTFTMGIMSS